MEPLGSPALQAIRSATAGSVFEGDLYLVGGAIRDQLLGLPQTSDLDLVTTGSTMELAELLAPISANRPVTYPRFGTALVKIGDSDVELVTSRAESYDGESRKPRVEAATLLDDALRRDFTVNTLMQDLWSGKVLDLTGKGVADLEARLLRTPLDPLATFFDDPLRMLRAVRFRWKLGFEPAPGLYEAIESSRERLAIISRERIRDELVKMILHPSAPEALNELMKLELVDQFAPELRQMVGCEQGKYHHLDVWDHSLLVLRNAWSSDLLLNLAALLHDVGKPPTRTIDEKGNTRFFGHEAVGESMTRRILRRLKFSQKQIDEVALLVKNHMRLGSSPVFTASAARRLLRDLDGETDRLLALVEADVNGLKAGVAKLDLEQIRDRLKEVQSSTPSNVLVSPLTGEEIMQLTGLEAGRPVGKLKSMLTEMVLEGKLAPGDKEGAKTFLTDLKPA